MQALVLLLVFAVGTLFWWFALSGSRRPMQLALVGNGALMTLLFVSLQPGPVAAAEVGIGAAGIPLIALLVIDGLLG